MNIPISSSQSILWSLVDWLSFSNKDLMLLTKNSYYYLFRSSITNWIHAVTISLNYDSFLGYCCRAINVGSLASKVFPKIQKQFTQSCNFKDGGQVHSMAVLCDKWRKTNSAWFINAISMKQTYQLSNYEKRETQELIKQALNEITLLSLLYKDNKCIRITIVFSAALSKLRKRRSRDR